MFLVTKYPTDTKSLSKLALWESLSEPVELLCMNKKQSSVLFLWLEPLRPRITLLIGCLGCPSESLTFLFLELFIQTSISQRLNNRSQHSCVLTVVQHYSLGPPTFRIACKMLFELKWSNNFEATKPLYRQQKEEVVGGKFATKS
jgi:hypothetical protein